MKTSKAHAKANKLIFLVIWLNVWTYPQAKYLDNFSNQIRAKMLSFKIQLQNASLLGENILLNKQSR